MNFLQLCQRVAQESGTVSDVTSPSSVTSQTGRLYKIVQWTADAYLRIQQHRDTWRWMEAEFEVETIAGTQRYTSASWNLDRWADWIRSDAGGEKDFSLYLSATGVSDEAGIAYEVWEDFYARRLRGSYDNARPQVFSISPAGEIVFWPKPDAVYTFRGRYRKTPQTLAADSDTPEMPTRFHLAIVWRALQLLADHDEAIEQQPAWMVRYMQLMGDLEREQLPRLRIGSGPLY